MTRLGGLLAVGLIAGASLAVVLPTPTAHSQTVVTKISLADFKAAYKLASVRKLLNKKSNGVSFWMTKRDKNGNKIDWSDPNRKSVDTSKSFIHFRSNGAEIAAIIDALMKVRVQFAQSGGPSIPAAIDCGLGGTKASGVNSVQCGGGAVVSPS
ncbi:MAG: hypothetical protein AB7I59_18905 [Geminicoccaceae bacterium]